MQLDITAEFELDKHDLEILNGSNTVYNCGSNGGASQRGALGPFGLLVLTDEKFTEQTPVYFYVSKDSEGNLTTFFCTDQSRFAPTLISSFLFSFFVLASYIYGFNSGIDQYFLKTKIYH